jgi:hypothetical protein
MSNWKDMDNWEVVLPPSRPTVIELKRIEEYIGKYNCCEPIAILGSTPEFRELLARLGFEKRFVFDKSVEFYLRMSNLLPNSVKEGEHFVVGEWKETIKEYKDYFKIILSDLTMGNICYADREQFYRSIAEAIKIGGTFIDKVLAFDFEVPTIRDLFEKYEKLPINLRTINDFSSEVLFCSELVIRKKIINSTEFYEYIDNGNYSEKIKYFSKVARMITPEGFIWYYGVPWIELAETYNSFYDSQIIFDEEDTTSPYYKRTKQFYNIK